MAGIADVKRQLREEVVDFQLRLTPYYRSHLYDDGFC